MGCGRSKAVYPNNSKPRGDEKSFSLSVSVQWKMLMSSSEAKAKFQADGTLAKGSDPGHLELRALLDDSIACHYLYTYCKDTGSLDLCLCWVDIQEFKSMPSGNYLAKKSNYIYSKYVKRGTYVGDSLLESTDRSRCIDYFDKNVNGTELTPQLFDWLQTICFVDLYNKVFQRFKLTEGYLKMNKFLKRKYNNVKAVDFDYMKVLGEGGFGLVCQCRKKSTGTL